MPVAAIHSTCTYSTGNRIKQVESD